MVQPSTLPLWGGMPDVVVRFMHPETKKDEFLIAAVGFFGTLLFFLLGKVFSSLLSVSYRRLSKADQISWNSRYATILYAMVVSPAVAWSFGASDVFAESGLADDPIVDRRDGLTQFSLVLSVGYFLADLAILALHAEHIGSREMFAHHVAALMSVFTAAAWGHGHMYVLGCVFTEVTTPFINFRWYLEKTGRKSTQIYLLNGVLIFLSWAVARIALFPFLFAHMWEHRHEFRVLGPGQLIMVLTIPEGLFLLNVFWFLKICRGMVRAFSGIRKPATKPATKVV